MDQTERTTTLSVDGEISRKPSQESLVLSNPYAGEMQRPDQDLPFDTSTQRRLSFVSSAEGGDVVWSLPGSNLEATLPEVDLNTTIGRMAPEVKALSRTRKLFILFIVSLAGVVAPLTSAIYLPSLVSIGESLNTTPVLVNASVSVFTVMIGIAPLFWAPVSDKKGRRPVYLMSLSILVVSSVFCGFAINIEWLLIGRIIQAIGSSAVLSVGAGTISDVFVRSERGRAMGIFFLGPLIGPIIGPSVGGVIGQYLSWRWIFWILAILSFFILVAVFFALPETLPLSKRNSPISGCKEFLPLNSLSQLRFPFVSLVVTDVCVIFFSLFSISTLMSRQFHEIYGLSESVIGLLYLPQGLGNVVGSVAGGWWSDRQMRESARRRGKELPEDRLRSTIPGIICLVGGFLLYGWSLQAALPVWIPVIGTFFVGMGLLTFSTSTNTYLVDIYPNASASIISVNNCLRYIASAISPLVVPYMIPVMGLGGTYSFMAALNLVAWFCVVTVAYKGRGWRESKEPWKSEAASWEIDSSDMEQDAKSSDVK
jgi:multidrug resistance protein